MAAYPELTMNPRKRILTLLAGNTPDRVPWMADLDYWSNSMVRRGEVPADFINSPAYFDLYRRLGIGFYLQGLFPFRAVYDPSVQVIAEVQGSRRLSGFATPLGTICAEWTYLPESFSEAPTRFLIRSAADLAVYAYVVEHTSYQPEYAELLRRQPLIGEQGVLLAYLPRSPLMQLVAELAGIQTVTALWMDSRPELERVLKRMEASHDQAAALALASPAECLMIPENLSSEAVGRRFFELYLRGYETRWVERIRQAGKYSFIHMDGTLKGLLRQVASVGFDVVEAVTPAPVGDLSFTEMRQLAGERVILWGGLPGVYFTDLVSDAEFDRFVQEALSVLRSTGRAVLGVADQVPPDGMQRRVARVAELVEQHGAYR
jgi:hypothetical protein